MKKFYSFVLMATALLFSATAWAQTTWPAASIQDINDALADENFANGDIIQLTADITNANTTTKALVTIAAGKVCTLDLNNHTISGAMNVNATYKATANVIHNLGTLTIENGSIINTSTSADPCYRHVWNAGTITMNNVTIDVKKGICFRHTSTVGTATLNNCIFTNHASYYGSGNANNNAAVENMSSTTTLTINSGRYESSDIGGALFNYSTTVINGGTFVDGNAEALHEGSSATLTIYGGIFSCDPAKYLSQTYTAILNQEDGYYHVSEWNTLTPVTANTLSELETALNSAGGDKRITVTLGSDITINKLITIPHGSTVAIPAGRTLTVGEGGAVNHIGMTANEGTISIQQAGYYSNPSNISGTGTVTAANSFNMSVNGGTIDYTISGPMGLQWLSFICSDYVDKTWNISLTQDISMPAIPFERIGEVHGTFNGNGHSIRNLKLQTVTESNALFRTFDGIFKNVVLDVEATTKGGTLSIVSINCSNDILLENVVVNGTITATGATFGVGSLLGYPGNEDNFININIVNCVNNAAITAPNGNNTGAFIGTVSGRKVNIGFYNCRNNGTVASLNANGAYIGYGAPAANSTLEIIACSNVGSTWASNKTAKLAQTATYADPAVYVAVYDEGESKYIAREIGAITQPVSATSDWAQNTTWIDKNSGNVVPTASDNVKISHNVVINNGTDAAAQGINFQTGGSLTVKDGGSLNVGNGGLDLTNGYIVVEGDAIVRINGEVINPDGQRIVIKSGEDGTAVFVVSPDYQMNNIPAEIQLYTTARKKGSEYIYNYIGIPTSTPITAATLDRAAVSGNTEDLTFRLSAWDVATGWHAGGWDDLSKPFRGVALTSESTQGTIFTFKGTLVGNNDGAMNFTRKGFNFFANSYTGPINIQTMLAGLSANVTATIYMYDSERNQIRSVNSGDFAGYFTPAFTVIPSMQGFFIFTENKSAQTENIDYRQMVWNNTAANSPLHAPARQAEMDFDRVCINVTSAAGKTDDVKLIGEETFSTQFDNGFDAVKYMNNGMNIYAVAENNLQNLYTDKLEGTFIGFAANADDEVYTLSFSNIAGEEYAIKDLYTGVVTPMTSTAIYTFSQTAGEDMSHRFQIIGRADAPTAVDNVEKAVAAEGIYTLTGMYIGTVDMWNALPQGVYVINGTKVVK